MKRSLTCVVKCLPILLALGARTLRADTVSSTRVYTDPPGESFFVDGQFFTSSATFLWPQGSKHTLQAYAQQPNASAKTRAAFTGWTDSSGILADSSPVMIITADPGITFYKAAFQVQYAVTLAFFNCGNQDPIPCGSPGTIFVNGTPYLASADVFLDAGSTVTLRAVPNPGFVFTGWVQAMGMSTQAYLASFTLNAPITVYPQFLRAGAVTIASDPPGLLVLADGTPATAPVTLDWGIGSTHTVGAVTPQNDTHSRLWVFNSWSDAGDATHAYTMPAEAAVTVTAKYVPGGRVSFFTNPPGLKLIIDGRDNWPGYNFSWSAGVPHTVSAASQQVDASGHGWAFQSWSNGGPASQVIALSAADVAAGFRLTASFSPSSQTTGQVSLQSSPSGVAIQVDGAACVTPCTLQRTIGSLLHVSAPASAPLGGDTRLDFAAWADSAAPDRTITVTSAAQAFTAIYDTYYRLACSADPASAATWHFAPAYTDGFYEAKTAVAVSLDVSSPYKFDHWEGDASGTSSATTVTMDRARNIVARLTRVGSQGIDTIGNAAGETPETAVAPGSIISVYGPRLAPVVATGPDSPLAQTLAGVTVTVGDQLLPLLFVSPGQINAELPSGLAAGDQILSVQAQGQPEVTGVFTVERNAPGLFSQQIAGKPYLIALHEDGSLVTPKSPARRGELVTALGTGFGPYQVQPPDGFAVPNSSTYILADKAELVFSDKVIEPESAGAAPGRVGVTAVRFRIADPLPAASTIEIKARVNGHESNTVLFPVE
jgi:uncharacterized protein (TIGR03437 family)